MSKTASGIQNYAQMTDKDKSYLLKMLGTILVAILSGIITGSMYNSGSTSTGAIGFSIWLASLLGFSAFIKFQFDLREMTDVQIVRHGILVGFFMYLFFWTVIFNYVIF